MIFKHKKDKTLFFDLSPVLIMVFIDLSTYAKVKHGVDITITATISTPAEDIELKRKSGSHQIGTALDFRTRDIPRETLDDIVNYIESKEYYDKYKYKSFSGVKRLAYVHNNGNGSHCHLQVHRKYAKN